MNLNRDFCIDENMESSSRNDSEEQLMNIETVALHYHRLQHAKTKKAVPGTGQLTYYIFEGVLTGIFGTEQLYVTAWSGGGGGAKKVRSDENTNNPYMFGLKAIEDKNKKPIVRGGPIPPGSWKIFPPGPHKGFKKMVCALEPRFTPPNDRGGFLIHSQGDLGSDGCIVLPDDNFDNVMNKLKKSAGGHLQVFQAMGDAAFV